MASFKNIILISSFILVFSCGTISEGFKSPKKNKSDEFLVEKKSPLRLPPDFDKLPTPTEKNSNKVFEEKNIQDLINKNKSSVKSNETDGDLEEKVLEKIREN